MVAKFHCRQILLPFDEKRIDLHHIRKGKCVDFVREVFPMQFSNTNVQAVIENKDEIDSETFFL